MIRLVKGFGLIVLFFAGSRNLFSVDFIRGDVNGDGVVSVSDAHYLENHLFRGIGEISCLSAADVNDDGNVDVSDSIVLLLFIMGGNPPPPPFPSPGADPTANMPGMDLTCDSYGGGTPLEDPAAKLEILEAVAQGGNDTLALITIGVSSSHFLAGYSGNITTTGDVFGDSISSSDDLTGTLKGGFSGSSAGQGKLRFAYLSALTDDGPSWKIPPGQDVPALRISTCVKPGTKAGNYALTLDGGELIDADSGRAIGPALSGGTLRVLSDVGGKPCEVGSSPPPPQVQVTAMYKLTGTKGSPGSTIKIPFTITSSVEVQGLTFSVDFDEEVLQGTAVTEVFQKPEKTPYDFRKYEFNNENKHPGNAGTDEGYVVGGVVFSFTNDRNNLPANSVDPFLEFEFLIRPETTAPFTELRFLDGGDPPDLQPITNFITVRGTTYAPDSADAFFILLNGTINVIPDVAAFVRGDSNGDGTVNISDAQRTLGYLFTGEARPSCFDAADANDDGRVDVSDPIRTLEFLFLGRGTLPPPNGAPGEDPTPDSLGCL